MQRKSFFAACHSGKLKLAFTSPDVISTSLKTIQLAEFHSSSVIRIFPQKTSLAHQEKLKTKFTSPMAKSIIHGLLDTTFFARCLWSSIAKERQVGSETGTLLGPGRVEWGSNQGAAWYPNTAIYMECSGLKPHPQPTNQKIYIFY